MSTQHNILRRQEELKELADDLRAGDRTPSPDDWLALVDFQQEMLRALLDSHRRLLDTLKQVRSERDEWRSVARDLARQGDELLALSHRLRLEYLCKPARFTVN